MRRGRVRAGMLAIGMLALVAVGCSSDDEAADTADVAEDAMAETEAAGDAGGVADDAAAGERGEAAEEPAPAVAVGGDTAGRDVIREASLTLASDDPASTVDAIGRAAEQAGGFVSGTDLHRDAGVLSGTVTVRVPADALAGTLDRIEDAGDELRSRQLSSRDVTGEVADVAAQLRNLRALEAELVALLAEARADGGTEAVLTVFDRVRGVRDEIERLEGRQASLADLVALATVTVRVEPTEALLASTRVVQETAPSPWDPGQQLQLAWDSTISGLRTAVDVLIVLVVTVLPLALLWGLPVVGAIVLVRRWRVWGGPSRPPAPSPAGAGSLPSPPESDRD